MSAVDPVNYAIKVLTSVSFDKELFFKELSKARKKLLPYDLEKLHKWLVKFLESKPELNSQELDFSY
ncbi:hypothetical protein EG240_01775 [Paenimyroides tangerinum]|uniref:Uncharacterized protein n=1 Tax=Paenimyroides tangerinum TaxID=2488728 RepID=A0A3P3WCI9_9FLAO|nr:hypothetical protein [Paenimyroides tangerinum]RRJ92770.1 hypothetical protein EG240_01775 [Paenimyroides tangerinum]